MTTQTRQVEVEAGQGDRPLIEALKRDQSAVAFEALLRRYQRPLFGFLRRQSGSRALAEDLFQQTALRIFHGIATCKDPSAFRAWAFGIAANLCRHEARQQRSRDSVSSSVALEERAGWTRSPEADAQDNQAREQIASALDALPESQREVFVLYHYTHLSYGEIAQAVGAPVGTVKSRMNSALTQLRTLLANLGEQP